MPRRTAAIQKTDDPKVVVGTLETGLSAEEYLEYDTSETHILHPLEYYHKINGHVGSENLATYCPCCARSFRPPLTPQEARYLDYIAAYFTEHGRSPTYRELEENATNLGAEKRHTNLTQSIMADLEAKGYLVRGTGWRNISLIPIVPTAETDRFIERSPRPVIIPQIWSKHFRKSVRGKRMPDKAPKRRREGVIGEVPE